MVITSLLWIMACGGTLEGPEEVELRDTGGDTGSVLETDEPDPCDELAAMPDSLHLDGSGAQAEIEAFCAEYNSLSGDLIIRQVDDISALACLCAVGGNLEIQSSRLTDLSGLEQLQTIEGSLTLLESDRLADISGLASLSTVGQHVGLGSMPALESSAPLAGITSVGGGVSFGNCDALKDAHIGDEALLDLSISSCDRLTDLSGLSTVRTLDANLLI